MPDVALVASRFTHYVALLSLFGLSCVPLSIGKGFDREQRGAAARAMRAALVVVAVLAVASGLAVFACVAAAMVGSWHDLDWDAVASVAVTGFGTVWIAHLVLPIAIVGLVLLSKAVPASSTSWALMTASGVALASMAGVGHTEDESGATKAVHVVADALHLLGAGAWMGGIVGLLLLITASIRLGVREDEAAAIDAAARFSGLGTAAVATLVLSGIVNGWMLVGSFRGLTSSAYGGLLLLKLALFVGMLLLAAINRYRIVRVLLETATGGARATLGRLRRHVTVEQVLGLAVILVVSWLGTMEPAINLKVSP